MCNIWTFLKKEMIKHGNKTALVCKDKTITYAELINEVESSNYIFESKIIVADNSDKLSNAVNILQIIASEGIAVPLNPEYGEVYCNNIRAEIEEKRLTTIDPDIALIMFTSGSSGKPKGVMLSHQNIISNIAAIDKYFRINQTDSILIARPLMHAAVLTGEFLVSLYKGLTIHFYTEAFIPQRVISYIKAHKITTFCATPTLIKLLCKTVKTGEELPLKNITVSGECLPGETAKMVTDTFADVNVYSVYGLTEASPRVSYLSPEKFKAKPGWVGVPIEGVEMKIINEDGKEIKKEGEGRLYVKSAGIMRGYLGEPLLTQTKLSNGWLDTGDVAKRDMDGDYYILGRSDDMIIRSGMNIYPEEIENALKTDVRIKQVLCYGEPDPICGEALCVIVAGEVTEGDITQITKVKLPVFMQPNKIRIVESVPLTPSGKIDRRTLKSK